MRTKMTRIIAERLTGVTNNNYTVCCRSRTFLGRIQPMSNVHLPFVSVYQRMTDFVHTLAYASVIRNSVTGV